MILTKEIEVVVNKNMLKYYKELGYNVKYGEKIIIQIEHLSSKSNILIHVKCDVCGKEKMLSHANYYKNNFKHNLYCCDNKCATIKNKKTCLEKYGDKNYNNQEKLKETCLNLYGVEHISQRKETQAKKMETCLKNNGVEYPFQSEEIRNKCKQTCLENHGVEYSTQSEEIRNKAKETCFRNYGVDSPMQSEDIKSKVKETCLKKYGCENPMQNEEIRGKRQTTCLENHGVEHPMQTEDIKSKVKETNLEKYGFECSLQNKNVKEKAKETRIEKGTQISDDKLSDWEIYKREVKIETRKYKKQLFDDWNGMDFYTGEFIKDNLTLNGGDKDYPTIDHKISIYEGFINNIQKQEIGNIKNLCITKRNINCSKGAKSHIYFKQIFNQ